MPADTGTPDLVRHCVAAVAKKYDGDTDKAFAVCVAQLQKNGYLKPGTMELTAAGKQKETEHESEPDAEKKLKAYEKLLKSNRKEEDFDYLLSNPNRSGFEELPRTVARRYEAVTRAESALDAMRRLAGISEATFSMSSGKNLAPYQYDELDTPYPDKAAAMKAYAALCAEGVRVFEEVRRAAVEQLQVAKDIHKEIEKIGNASYEFLSELESIRRSVRATEDALGVDFNLRGFHIAEEGFEYLVTFREHYGKQIENLVEKLEKIENNVSVDSKDLSKEASTALAKLKYI
jgi:hypothetical protein